RKISSTGASTNSQKNALRVTKRRSCEPVFILYSGSRCPQAAAVSSGFSRQRRGLVVRTVGDNKAVQIHQYTNTKGHTTPQTRPVDRHNNVLSGHVAQGEAIGRHALLHHLHHTGGGQQQGNGQHRHTHHPNQRKFDFLRLCVVGSAAWQRRPSGGKT